jgi:RHS repeat-associated protein
VPRVLVREELNGTPTIAVYGPGLLYEVEASGVVRYYHYDETGSIIALTDASGLVATDRIGYGPFGTLVVRKGTTATPYLYGGTFGVETDPNGLLYMRARYYHPLLRRFISPDPVGFAGGLNWYVYAGHNPSQFGDPTGLGKDTVMDGGLLTRLQGVERAVLGAGVMLGSARRCGGCRHPGRLHRGERNGCGLHLGLYWVAAAVAGRADGGGGWPAHRVIFRQPGRLGNGGGDRLDGGAGNWVSSPTASTCIQACWRLWGSR